MSNSSAVDLEIFIFSCWLISLYSTTVFINIRIFLVSLGTWFVITHLKIVKLHAFIHNSCGYWNYIQFNLRKLQNKNPDEMRPCIIAAADTVWSIALVGRLKISRKKKMNMSESIPLKLNVRLEHMYSEVWKLWIKLILRWLTSESKLHPSCYLLIHILI